MGEYKFKFEPNDNYYFLFRVNDNEIDTIRNLYVGKLYGDQTCYLASFNTKNSYELLHYSKCGDGYTEAQKIDGITSNILIMNN